MKTAGRILGTALFLEGFDVQDAPRYGAERRGAPITSYVRATHGTINERGIIPDPDLVVVADDTLVGVPAAGVLQGLDDHSVLLIDSAVPAAEWRTRINFAGLIVILPAPTTPDRAEIATVGVACAGAAARLIGGIGRSTLIEAVRQETQGFGEAFLDENIAHALTAFDAMASFQGHVKERSAATPSPSEPPAWTLLTNEDIDLAGPAIHAGATSVEVRTGLWRILRPVIDYDRCNRCTWVCGSFCPDNAISVSADGRPVIDYDHCKGCMICVAQCPPHAIDAIPETQAREKDP